MGDNYEMFALKWQSPNEVIIFSKTVCIEGC